MKFKCNEEVIVSQNYKVRKGCVGTINGGQNKNKIRTYLVKMSDGESFWIPEEFLTEKTLEHRVGDVVNFEHENDPNIIENLVVEEIVDQWDKGKKIRCARCGGSLFDVRFLTIQKRG